MSSSTWLGDVGSECAWWAAESVVECDGGCEREEAGGDAGSEAAEGAGAVAFEREQVFAGLEDRLDPLAYRREVGAFAGLVLAARPGDQRLEPEGVGLELPAGVALVADHGHRTGAVDALKQRQARLALADLGARERQRAWGAVGREQGVQPKAPEVAAVA